MATIKYYGKENTTTGSHSCFAIPVLNGRLTFDEMCDLTGQKTGLSPVVVRAAIEGYIHELERQVARGFRVPVGQDFVTLYAGLRLSVKDERDAAGLVTRRAALSQLSAAQGRTIIESTVSRTFNRRLSAHIHWEHAADMDRPAAASAPGGSPAGAVPAAASAPGGSPAGAVPAVVSAPGGSPAGAVPPAAP